MKIAQVVCTFPPYAGGIATVAAQIDRLLKPSAEIVNFTPYNLKPWLKYGHGAFLPQLLWKLRKFDYIYLHYPFFGGAEVVWFFKLFFKKPKLIIHYHMDVRHSNLIFRFLSWPARLIRSSLFKQADLIVSASFDYIAHSQIKNYYRARADKFREIPFGLDIEKFQAKMINRQAANSTIARAQKLIHYINDRFIKKRQLDILFVGGLDRAHYFKGVDILLKALSGLTKRNWRLVIAGEGELRYDYETLARELKIADKIKFVGRLDDAEKIRYYQNTDLLILPSINSNEAFGLVLIEALACGAPVIASNLPGVRRVFSDQTEGLLAAPGDANDLREKIKFILDNEALRRTMALAARSLAEEKYDEKKMATELRRLFI